MLQSPPTLSTVEVAALLDSTLQTVRAELSALPEAVLAWHPAPGEWCVKEAIGHIIEADRRGFDGRVRLLLEVHEPEFQGWDQLAVARDRQDCQRPSADILAEFTELRERGISLVGDLDPSQLSRGGSHERVGYLSIADLLQEWVHHDRNHVRQALANVQAYVWPAMGNAQRFSSG
jgi:DinB superfamily